MVKDFDLEMLLFFIYFMLQGSVSVSMLLHETSFCFVCTHLTSGLKEGDELRQNSDFLEIVKKIRFPRVKGMKDDKSPQTILEHDRIIWLGDLNYRIALSYRSAKALVEMQNWRALLEKDQLRIEQRRGRVFQGWNEEKIYFPPTYQYLTNSDRYTGDNLQHKEKRRTPAWT
ncbi:type IV inositol polyphosphate 5-phosphatase 6-like isoform X2 [Rutidosis leptorrhynchoides]|uniref:type IV inositol polyphosphate 5-phosphatase 6-like isoform X2 n=1 Tax=Rutidosis leptorrhynchoides TaxID=125765 RepID=UPI003A99E5DB